MLGGTAPASQIAPPVKVKIWGDGLTITAAAPRETLHPPVTSIAVTVKLPAERPVKDIGPPPGGPLEWPLSQYQIAIYM